MAALQRGCDGAHSNRKENGMSLLDSITDIVKSAFGGQPSNDVPQEVVMAVIQSCPGGLDGMLSKLHAGGLTNVVSSWLGPGQNAPINADQLRSALGNLHVEQLASQLGLPADQALSVLAQHLPNIASGQTTH
jgi:uncharacterized protein YidB (DUF937 family)